MASSLRSWLILSFLLVLFICLTSIGLFLHALNKSREFADFSNRLKSVHIMLYQINDLKEEILTGDQNNNRFYFSEFSDTEQRYANLSDSLLRQGRRLSTSAFNVRQGTPEKIRRLRDSLSHFTRVCAGLFSLYKIKGFKNYGLEGTMREYAHRIYESGDQKIQHYCLRLRRHEKDFLLRKDLLYVHQFNQVSGELINYLRQANYSKAYRNLVLRDLFYYQRSFLQLSRIETRIGIRGKSGLLNASAKSLAGAGSLIGKLDAELAEAALRHKNRLRRDAVLVVIILVGVLSGTIAIITGRISSSVKSVTGAFNQYIDSGFRFEEAVFARTRIREFNIINTGFLKMAREINIFTNFFREKVNERTREISGQKNEIMLQRRQIEEQYQALLNKNKQLSARKKLLIAKNQDIRDSLLYAKRIQSAIQPRSAELRAVFPESFVFSKAKDVVSGDFFLCYNKVLPQNTLRMIVAADCTGHGVPGAMMSVLGINTIHRHIRQSGRSEPGEILNLLDQDFNQLLAQGKKSSDIVADGMDIGIFAFDETKMRLEYSIARFGHCLVKRDGSVCKLQTSRMGIGHHYFMDAPKQFSTSVIEIERGDQLYLFSDGFADQFGGLHNKKYKRSRLQNLIAENHHKNMSDQKAALREAFGEWKGSHLQTDDVLLIGIRF